MRDKNPWITLDYDSDEAFDDCFVEELIVGNKEGLELLQEAVKDSLSNSEAIVLKDSGDRINMGILLRERENNNVPIKETLKDSILKKVFISLAFCWFVILPFLAIFLIYDNINSNGYSFEFTE